MTIKNNALAIDLATIFLAKAVELTDRADDIYIPRDLQEELAEKATFLVKIGNALRY